MMKMRHCGAVSKADADRYREYARGQRPGFNEGLFAFLGHRMALRERGVTCCYWDDLGTREKLGWIER